jgi:hypothetical protein
MKQYTEAAQTAHDNLMPLVDAALASAKDRLEKAKACADHEAITPQLVAMIDKAGTPSADAVGGILATYAALLNNPATRDGAWLMRNLASAVKHHSLTPAQASQIAGAMLAAIKGNAPASLIEFPAADVWSSQLHHADLQLWAAWLNPDAHTKLMTGTEKETVARIAAETDLIQLERARNALADIVPTYINSKVVKIRSNNADRPQGTAGFKWQPLETLEVAPMDYARLVSGDGFNRLLESGQLEVVV